MRPVLLTAATLFVFSAPVMGGSLTPPGGPVAPTMKTLNEVEPRTPLTQATAPGDPNNQFIISQPGSYYLTGPIEVSVAGRVGILVTSSDVRIDLRGFAIDGGGVGSTAALSSGALERVGVRNGTVTNWAQFGVRLDSVTQSACEDLELSATGLRALLLGDQARITDCSAFNTEGMHVGLGGLVESSVVIGATGTDGFSALAGSTFTNCISIFNGLAAFATGGGCTFRNCTGSLSAEGFDASNWCLFESCLATENFANGFSAGPASLLRGCVAADNGGNGFELSARSLAENCLADSNATGFQLVGECVLEGCTASSSSGIGILATNTRATLIGCGSSQNGDDGVTAANTHLRIVDSYFFGNSSTGVVAVAGGSLNISGSTIINSGTRGITADRGLVESCHIEGSSTDGIRMGTGLTDDAFVVRNNIVRTSGNDGISIFGSGRVENNVVEQTDRFSIVLSSNCTAIGNLVVNGDADGDGIGAAIVASVDNNVLDGNHVSAPGGTIAANSIQINGDNNLIVRNIVYLPGNIAPVGGTVNNLVGPVNDLTSPHTNFIR